MIDLHSHILPGIDDGAKDFDQALTMLKMAIESGVKNQVLTPHIDRNKYNNIPITIKHNFEKFNERLKKYELPIQIHLSAEVRVSPELITLLDDSGDSFPWLGSWNNNKVILLEFPQNLIPSNSINLIRWLINQNIVPMIAHPERNLELQANPEKIYPYIDCGCLIQITAGSLLSAFGMNAMKMSEDLLKKGKVTVIASDCHNTKYRPPNLHLAYQKLTQIVDENEAIDIVQTNPTKILNINY